MNTRRVSLSGCDVKCDSTDLGSRINPHSSCTRASVTFHYQKPFMKRSITEQPGEESLFIGADCGWETGQLEDSGVLSARSVWSSGLSGRVWATPGSVPSPSKAK